MYFGIFQSFSMLNWKEVAWFKNREKIHSGAKKCSKTKFVPTVSYRMFTGIFGQRTLFKEPNSHQSNEIKSAKVTDN